MNNSNKSEQKTTSKSSSINNHHPIKLAGVPEWSNTTKKFGVGLDGYG
jgi:hypothetical protein